MASRTMAQKVSTTAATTPLSPVLFRALGLRAVPHSSRRGAYAAVWDRNLQTRTTSSDYSAAWSHRPSVESRRWFSDSTTNSSDGNAKPKDGANPDEGTAPPPVDESSAAEQAASTIETLEGQVKDLKDQLLRSLAEQENTRRIAQRDVESARQFAIKSFAKSLLDVSDNLSLALESVPVDLRNDKETHPILANLYEGIQMTDRGLAKAFELNGLVKYGQAGDAFDPNKHEALFEYVDPQKEPGTVGQVMKPGFLLNNRVLRPAEVGVVKKG